MMQKTYTLSTDEVLKNLGVDENGLSDAQAKERLEKYGCCVYRTDLDGTVEFRR